MCLRENHLIYTYTDLLFSVTKVAKPSKNVVVSPVKMTVDILGQRMQLLLIAVNKIVKAHVQVCTIFFFCYAYPVCAL